MHMCCWFAGDTCLTDINECASNPCIHGTCHDGVNLFSCACTPGYGGPLCQTDINECASNPCVHGTCHDGVNSRVCVCLAGFTGPNCETNIDECRSQPCTNGYTCVDGINSFVCTNSDSALQSECASSPCQNGGSCVTVTGLGPCVCAVGWTGRYCSTSTANCQSSPCLNGGTCVDGAHGRTCTCNAFYTGVDCQTLTNEGKGACSSSLFRCYNAATCGMKDGGPYCFLQTWNEGRVLSINRRGFNHNGGFDNRSRTDYHRATFVIDTQLYASSL